MKRSLQGISLIGMILLLGFGISLLLGCASHVMIIEGGPDGDPIWTVKNPVDEVTLERTTTEGETVNTVKLVVKKKQTDGNPITWAINLVVKSFNFLMGKADIQINAD